MKRKKVFALVLVHIMIFVSIFASQAMAFGKHHPRHRHNIAVELLAKSTELGLGAEQINKISAALAEFNGQRESAMANLKTARSTLRADLKAAWEANKENPTALGNSITQAYGPYYAALAQFKGTMAVNRLTMVKNLKTDPQIAAAIETLRTQHKQKFQSKVEKEINQLQTLQNRLQ